MASTWPKDIDLSLWEVAQGIVRTSKDLKAIESACKFLLDPHEAITMLAECPKPLLHRLCRHTGSQKADLPPQPASLAQLIVEAIRGPSLSGQRWDLKQPNPAKLSTSNTEEIGMIAGEFDAKVQSALRMITFPDLVSFSIGRKSFISDCFDTLSNLLNDLAQRVESEEVVPGLKRLQKQLQHPLSLWVVSNATSPFAFPHPEPSESLEFLFGPIRKLFEKNVFGNQLSVPQILERLEILEERYKSRITHGRKLGNSPLSMDFTLWDAVRGKNSDHLARSHTESVIDLFSKLSTRDVLRNLLGMRNIATNWLNLADDVLICLNVDGKLTDVFMNLADHFLELQNVHSATAVGMGLWKSQFQCPPQWSTIWGVINPEGNFAGSRSFMDENHCLPCLIPYMVDLPGSLRQIFRFVGYDAGLDTRDESHPEEEWI